MYGYCNEKNNECIVTEYYPLGSVQDLQEKNKKRGKDLDLKVKYHILTQVILLIFTSSHYHQKIF